MFKFCVSNYVTEMKSWEECTWTDAAEHGNIIIDQSSKDFKKNFKYGVIVAPIVQEGGHDGDFAYNLVLSSQDTFINIIEGLPSRITVLTTPRLFRLELDPRNSTKDMAILLTTLDSKAKLEASTSKSDILSSTSSGSLLSSVGLTANIFYSSQMIFSECFKASNGDTDRPCYLYIKVTPDSQMPYEYTLLAFTTNKPVYITDGSVISLPTPATQELVLEYTPTSVRKGVDINLYSELYDLEIVAKVSSLQNPTGLG